MKACLLDRFKRGVAMKRSLHGDVFAAFARACEEREFELAEHLLRALEAIAREQSNSDELDVAYALLARCDQPRRTRTSRTNATSN